MKVIVCVEDNYGISLFGKRLSFDRIVFERIKEITRGHKLYSKEASDRILYEHDVDHEVIANFQDANSEDFVFLEFESLSIDMIDEMYIFHWNRKYPSNLKFHVDFTKYTLIESEEFKGYSHEIVRMEKYVKKV